MIEWVLFGMLTAVALVSAVMMLASRSAVHSALWLVLTFFAISGFFLTLGAQFLAVVQVIVYAGAIMVLFLFVVMLLNPEREREPAVPRGGVVAASVLGAAFLGIVGQGVATRAGLGTIPTPAGGLTIQKLGLSLYNEWLFPFELASILLLVAMIGAIVLAKRRV